jgi:hypothetical protein
MIRLSSFLTALAVVAFSWPASSAGQRFYSDDPLSKEPETQDASGAQPRDIEQFPDLMLNVFVKPGDKTLDVRAGDVNTIDEVPDSSWFTNRIYARSLTVDEIGTGPLTGKGPAEGRWLVTRGKAAGVSPGFTAKDSQGETWFIQFDSKGYPRAATGAVAAATRLFWALGYNQVESHLTHIDPKLVEIDPSATISPRPGYRRKMNQRDIDRVFARSAPDANALYRAVAGRMVQGKALGGFKYFGTRSDDPNDLVPHEHRRSLRALRVFGAWTNLVDMKAGNTLDTIVTENGRGIIRHYLQDVGSTFGTGALAPHDWDDGYEFFYEGDKIFKRLVSLGFYIQPWQTVDYKRVPEVGRFEGDVFDPRMWKPIAPPAAYLRARDDDNFWAALRVAAFTDEQIGAAAMAAQYKDKTAIAHLGDVLIKRRDKIAKVYLTAINPVTRVAIDGGALSFENAAVRFNAAPPPDGGYEVTWSTFDNASGETTPIGQPGAGAETRLPAPSGLPTATGAFVKASIRTLDKAHPEWARPVDAYFRKSASGWSLVGLDRTLAPPPAGTVETN